MSRPAVVAALLASLLAAGLEAVPTAAASVVRTDVLVYGATPGGVLAAVTAARAGVRVVLLEPRRHVGGMMSSGLGWTDIGDKRTVGGYAKEFFDRVQALEGTADGRWHFEPHVAEDAFRAMLHAAGVVVRYGERLPDTGGLVRDTRIRSLKTTTGTTYQARVFIDATYEGDLLARAGVTNRLGREARTTYGESLAGVRPSQTVVTLPDDTTRPYLTPAPGAVGSGDGRIQDSNYRVCFSSDPANRVPFTAPAGYRSRDYDVYVRYLAARQKATGQPASLGWLLTISPLANDKYDVNDFGPLSSAIPGLNWPYPTATWAARLDIEAAHRRSTQGLFFHLANNRRVPATVRDQMRRYGLCKDEFADNGNWPRLLYLREGRRMVGEYVLRQSDIELKRSKPDIIGVASYRVDSHYVSRWVTSDDRLMVEGSMGLPYQNYAIPYRAITPKRTEVTNLLVPVAASASHVAQSSLRMEPQYMIMGEAAGEAAAMTVNADTWVQSIAVPELQRRLRAHGAYLVNPADALTAPLPTKVDGLRLSPGG